MTQAREASFQCTNNAQYMHKDLDSCIIKVSIYSDFGRLRFLSSKQYSPHCRRSACGTLGQSGTQKTLPRKLVDEASRNGSHLILLQFSSSLM